ncbi:isoleucine--tRNA ligase [Niallia nealsonii]|uniref:Isoleucine--tRNA ligase n=1 Tax=Niallia nealsonii TaxID=115979 RepID=A0A2N0Z302_9BACI|nr:isoleucine--tRNA ligase [Niallia nealsonii]PKG23884.1 isoleucine--tRNA ligase [Niallia nealsonii]
MKKETAQQREQKIRKQWQQQKTFQHSISKRQNESSFVFYEGPPTANGLPHVGHALGRTIKDVVARYKTMAGYQVIRKAGWDTHGLPVELGVEKQLGISGKKAIEEYGVKKFIDKCKESVFTYEKQWREFTEQLGYWVDMDDPYITLTNDYIESVWHILGTIHEKNLLYKGHRVSPYCPSCQTSLSSHEVAQGYKTVKDLTVTVKFPIKTRKNEYFLAWTTTPWTLPANVCLAVHPNLSYARVKKGEDVFIVAESLVERLFQTEHKILSVLKGENLIGLDYTAPFDFVNVEKGHKVVGADYVTAESGTGIVHIAPAYGEDDYQVVRQNEFSFVNVVDEKGVYTEEVSLFQGRFVKDCDVDIIRFLTEKGLLFDKSRHEHSYPHCWRCDSPLLYYANESWFIETTALKEQFLKNNEEVTWHPDHIKHGRFGHFLEQMVDWNISRKRYWGTPLNVWQCSSCNHETAPKSIKELQEKAVSSLKEDVELHKPFVDDIVLLCSKCGGDMKRTPEVIDVWFDSGSMPFAQYHQPFENKKLFQSQFPADVVIEGIDQTRGWFYSLLAVSTLYTGKAPYKRVLSLGHVLDEQGQKMSKSKGNALDPMDLIENFGADALRWALIADSAPWNPKRFSERAVMEAKSKVIDTFVNIHSFYTLYAELDGFDPQRHDDGKNTILDTWMISRIHTTIYQVTQHLEAYQFTNAAREIGKLIEEISNWYVRRSRNRFWSEGMTQEKAAAYQTLYTVLTKTSQLLAPFTPFLAEDVYRQLTGESVHLSNFPVYDSTLLNDNLEKDMQAVLDVVELGRSIRNTASLKVKQPLAGISVVNRLEEINWKPYEGIILEELNVKQFQTIKEEELFSAVTLKLDFRKSGHKFGKNANIVNNWLQQLSSAEVSAFLVNGLDEAISPKGEKIPVTLEDVMVEKKAKEGFSSASNEALTVTLDVTITEELMQEGVTREFIRAVQEYRKQLNLPINLRVNLEIGGNGPLIKAITNYQSMLKDNLLMRDLKITKEKGEGSDITINGETVFIHLVPAE